MSLHFYHPNKANKGFACSFWFSERDQAIYATIIRQSGWDETNQNGTFKANAKDPTKKVNIKLSFTEACGILDCVERNRPFSQYHDSEASPKQIGFSPWMSKAWTDAEGKEHPASQSGFSFTVTVINKETNIKDPFYIALSYAEARYIREFIIYQLHQSFKEVPYTLPSKPINPIAQPEIQTTETVPNEAKPSNNQAAQPVKDLLTGL